MLVVNSKLKWILHFKLKYRLFVGLLIFLSLVYTSAIAAVPHTPSAFCSIVGYFSFYAHFLGDSDGALVKCVPLLINYQLSTQYRLVLCHFLSFYRFFAVLRPGLIPTPTHSLARTSYFCIIFIHIHSFNTKWTTDLNIPYPICIMPLATTIYRRICTQLQHVYVCRLLYYMFHTARYVTSM